MFFFATNLRCSFVYYIVILALQTSLMDIHNDIFFRSILEDGFIFLAFRIYICFSLGKGARLWLVATPSICSFYIAHSTFILALYFRLNLI
jgi:hypothetical protein